MHHTVATGEVVGKEAAGEYALATFDRRWHPVVAEALAYRRDEPVRDPSDAGRDRLRDTAAFALAAIGDAHAVAAGTAGRSND